MKTETVQEREHRLRVIEGETEKERSLRFVRERRKNDDVFAKKMKEKTTKSTQRFRKLNPDGNRKLRLKDVYKNNKKEGVFERIKIIKSKKNCFKVISDIIKEYINIKTDSDICFTCDKKISKDVFNEKHLGHYIGSNIVVLRWNVNNLKYQCFECNIICEGRKNIYIQKLEKDIVDKLNYLEAKYYDYNDKIIDKITNQVLMCMCYLLWNKMYSKKEIKERDKRKGEGRDLYAKLEALQAHGTPEEQPTKEEWALARLLVFGEETEDLDL